MSENLNGNQQLQTLLRTLGEVVYQHDVPNDRIRWSDAVLPLFGYSLEQMGQDGNSWLSRVHPEDLDEVNREFERAKKSDGVFELRYRFLHQRGDYIWVHDRGLMERDEQGELLAVYGIVRNVHQEMQEQLARRHMEQRYRLLLENYPGGMIFLFDVDLTLLFAEGRALSALGQSKESIVGKKPEEILEDSLASLFREQLKGVLHGQERQFEIDFHPTIHKATATPVFNEQGQVHRCLLLTQDVTSEVHTRQRLVQSEARYRSLSEGNEDAIFLLNLNEEITFVNPAAARLFHASVDELLGRPIEQLFPPEIYQRMHGNMQRVMEQGENLRGEERYVFPQGEVWLHTHLTPVRQGDRITGLLGVSRDFTYRKRAEIEQQRSEERFRNLFEQASDALYVRRGSRFLLANPAFLRLFRLDSVELTAPEFDSMELVQQEDRELVLGEMSKAPSEPRGPYEFRGIARDGRALTLRVTTRPVDWDGTPAVLGSLQDISAERRLRNEQERIQRLEAVQAMIVTIAHEFRNPLSILQGTADLLVMEEKNSEALSRMLPRISRSVDRMDKLVRRLVELKALRETDYIPGVRMIDISEDLPDEE